jgi:dTDP-4-dehydrorhamnose reductase
MKKMLILGSNGLLGQNLVKTFQDKYKLVTASKEVKTYIPESNLEYFTIDLTQRRETRDLLNKVSADIIINTAAFTNVDLCEKNEEKCWAVNVRSVENIIEGTENTKTVLVQLSTDYVFNGKHSPYHENSETEPLGVYGRSKLAAENIIKGCPLEYQIIRTQVLFGTGNEIRPNFVTWVIEQLKNNNRIKVVNDQIGSPTYVPDLCTGISNLLKKRAYGVFHISSESSISRYDFAIKIAEVFGLDQELIESAETEQLKQSALRPVNSTFIIDKLVNYTQWQPNSLDEALIHFNKELES